MTVRCAVGCASSPGSARGGATAVRTRCCAQRAGAINRKRVQRLWREEGLRVPLRRRKRYRLGTSTVPAKRLSAERPDHVWALDFQFDRTADGQDPEAACTSSMSSPARPWRSSAAGGSTLTTP